MECYNCKRPAILDGSHNQRCPDCHVVLNPAPAWATNAGWPDEDVTHLARIRLPRRCPVGIKKVRFRTRDEHLIARRLEAVSLLRRVRMNDLLLSILDDWYTTSKGGRP